MKHLGKLLGGLIGIWLFRHWSGAIPGFLLGSWFDQRLSRVARPDAPAPASTPRDDDFRILGLQPGADSQSIEQAWRRMMARYHPDRATESGRAEAEQRCGEINAAYRRLRRRRRAA